MALREPARPLTPAAAARAILALQLWHPGGIQTAHPDDPRARAGKIYGGKSGPLGVVTHLHLITPHATLKDLLLNLPPQPRTKGDQPIWERSCPTPLSTPRAPAGRLD